MPGDAPPGELLHLLIAGHEAAHAASGEGAVAHLPGWFVADSGTGIGDLDHAVALDPRADLRVPEAWFGDRALDFRVIIPSPGMDPVLETATTRGYRELMRRPLMTRPLPGDDWPLPSSVTVIPVADENSARDYLAARIDPSRAEPPADAEIAFVLNATATSRFRYFVARHDREPIGTAMALDCDKFASINNVFVRDEWRRRGLGAALTAVAARAFPSATVATLEATAMGEPVYERMGFVRQFDYVRLAPRRISLRPMDHEADYAAISRWLSDPRVLEWYEGRDKPHSVAMIREHYNPARLAAEEIRACIIEVDGEPSGYLQYYPVADPADYEVDDATGTWAADLFIGEPALWSTGAGSIALRHAIHAMRTFGATRILIDPRLENPRAIRAYEKVGFRPIKTLVAHELHEGADRDCLLMSLNT